MIEARKKSGFMSVPLNASFTTSGRRPEGNRPSGPESAGGSRLHLSGKALFLWNRDSGPFLFRRRHATLPPRPGVDAERRPGSRFSRLRRTSPGGCDRVIAGNRKPKTRRHEHQQIRIPEVIFGQCSIKALGQCALRLGARRVLIVSDPGLAQVGWVEKPSTSWRNPGSPGPTSTTSAPTPATTRFTRAPSATSRTRPTSSSRSAAAAPWTRPRASASSPATAAASATTRAPTASCAPCRP